MASILCLLKKRTCEIPGKLAIKCKIQGPWKKIKWLFTITCLGPRQLGPRWQSGSGWSGWPPSPSRGARWTVTRRRYRNCYPRRAFPAVPWLGQHFSPHHPVVIGIVEALPRGRGHLIHCGLVQWVSDGYIQTSIYSCRSPVGDVDISRSQEAKISLTGFKINCRGCHLVNMITDVVVLWDPLPQGLQHSAWSTNLSLCCKHVGPGVTMNQTWQPRRYFTAMPKALAKA